MDVLNLCIKKKKKKGFFTCSVRNQGVLFLCLKLEELVEAGRSVLLCK